MLTEQQWDNLLKALYNENCILLLGPAISSISDSVTNHFTPLAQQLAQQLSKELDEEEIVYDTRHKNNIGYIAQLYEQLKGKNGLSAAYEVKDFYAHNQQPNAIHQILASLPFHLIINTTPDDLMLTAMQQNGHYKAQFQHYNFNKPQKKAKKLTTPSQKRPIIYNLFGHYEDTQSIVMSQAQQLLFTQAIIQKTPRIPNLIASQFDRNKTYLFLGFNWEEWHLPFVFNSFFMSKYFQRSMGQRIQIFTPQRNPLSPLTPQCTPYAIRQITKDFYRHVFQFKFVDDHLFSFTQTLKSKYDQHTWTSKGLKNVFIAAADEDKSYRADLCKSLKPLEQASKISIWHKGKVLAGLNTNQITATKMADAALILLLISADFLASKPDVQQELELALNMHRQQQAQVIPIIIRPCDWEEVPQLRQLYPILPNAPKSGEIGKPISTWKHPEKAYKNIIEAIKKLL